MAEGTLSPKQIENWRRTLTRQYGPMVRFLSDEEIQQYRDNMQAAVDRGVAKDGQG